MNPYQNKAYQNEGLPELLESIPEGERRVLDIGCGAGDNARILRSLGREVHGVTLSEKEAALARPFFHRLTVADVQTWEPDYPPAFFDAILLSHVIEHLTDPQTTLKRLSKYLRPGGTVYVAAPNVLFWKQRLQFLIGRFDYQDQGILDRTHLRFFTVRTLRELLENAGYEVKIEKTVGHFPFGPVRKFSPRFAARIDQALCRWLPGLFAFHLICVANSKRA
jgi:2-polyprenyl-3-methyl-5-hydroxy-6-metoxy-1,4-benzoquinol methylase